MQKRIPPTIPLSHRLRGLPPSATLAINERSDALRAQGRRVYKLGLGQSPFPVPEPVVASLRAHAQEKDYLPVKGLPELREAVAAFDRRQQGLDIAAADVLIGPGSKELMFLLQLVSDAELLVPSPSWVSYAPQARILGRAVRWVPTSGPMLTAADLDAACRESSGPRILILNYPSNPVGSTLDAQELGELAEVARAHGILVVSDEIYGELHHSGEHVSIARFYPQGTILSSGLSKWCGAGGWRLGTFSVPGPLHHLLDAMAAAASETFTSVSAPIQYAAVSAFRDDPAVGAYVRESRRVLRGLARLVDERLRSAGLGLAPLEGGFYAWVDFSGMERSFPSSVALCEQLLDDTGVAILAGSHFGRPVEEPVARLAYVDFDGALALAAASEHDGELPDAFFEEHCADTVSAIDLIAGWARR